MSERIDILLAVYNGAKYLREQLDSLVSQDAGNWSLLIRDDGSRDGSREILSAFRSARPAAVEVIFGDGRETGTMSNFSALLQLSRARYAMFCDQDDVWLPGKIAVTLGKMRELEREHGRDCPLLVHTDMKVTDADLHVRAESLWRFQKSDPNKGAALNRLLVQNCATGCSMMINAALRDLALPIPPGAMMHDWWLALVAAAFGRIGHVAAPTMLYRQHAGNDIGAKEWGLSTLAWSLMRSGGMRRLLDERKGVFRGTRSQARAFLERYGGRLSPGHRRMLEAYLALDELPALRRKWHMAKFGFLHTGIARNVARFLLW